MEAFKIKKIAIKIGRGLKYTLFAINVIFIILLILSTKAHDIPPSQSIFIAYLGQGFIILLFINVLYLFLWIISFQWKFILIQFIAFAFCIDAIATYIPINKREAKVPEGSICLMSYNVRGFNWLAGQEARDNPIFEYILNQNADIICFQEFAVEKWQDRKSLISLKEFDAVMKDYPYRSIIRLGDTDGSVIYGIACYSKYPIRKVARLPLNNTYFNGSAMYELRIGDQDITIVSNHLESNHITLEDKLLYKELVVDKSQKKIKQVAKNMLSRLKFAFETREIQANIIANCIAKQRNETEKMIICGDFNDAPMSYAYSRIKGDFIDAYKANGRGIGITYHEDNFLFRIDYIMYTPNIKSYDTTVGDAKYSDHYPIWTYIKL